MRRPGTTHDIKEIDREVGDAQRLLGDLLDERRLFRPYAGGGILGPRCFSPEAVDYLCEHGYTTVMFNCVPRDWERPEDWPEEAFRQGEQFDWMLLCLHDLGATGAMRQLPRFLDDCADRGIEFAQEYPADCVPIRRGEVVGSLDGLVMRRP